MPRALQIHFLPSLMDATQLAGGTAVIIDILRASSTIITALANGAVAVAPRAAVPRMPKRFVVSGWRVQRCWEANEAVSRSMASTMATRLRNTVAITSKASCSPSPRPTEPKHFWHLETPKPS